MSTEAEKRIVKALDGIHKELKDIKRLIKPWSDTT